jgi:hypothetical protein
MGYIGLLLNAPYKIDSMVWMWMWITLILSVSSSVFESRVGYRNQAIKWG